MKNNKKTKTKKTHETRFMQFALKPTFINEDKKELPLLFKKIIIL